MQDMMQQWMELNRSITDSLKAMTDANTTVMNDMAEYTVGSRQFAEFMKTMLDTGKALEDNRQEFTNKLLQSLLGNVDLQAGGTALKELGDINASAMTRLVENQMNTVNAYIKSTADHLEELQAAKSTDDLMAAQMHLFSELQEKMKSNALDTLQVMNGIKTAMQGWTEKTLANAAESDKTET